MVQMVQQTRLWTPTNGISSGLLVVARQKPLALVVGGRIIERKAEGSADGTEEGAGSSGRRGWQVTLGGIIVSSTRQKEPTRVIGHPDLASGASVQRGEVLYVSVAEAIYRETRGEEVEVHLTPTQEDAESLADLRVRARHRWDSDRLPDGWTRPLTQKMPQEKSLDTGSSASPANKSGLPDDLRELAERIRAKEENQS